MKTSFIHFEVDTYETGKQNYLFGSVRDRRGSGLFSQLLVAWPSEEGGLRTEATSHLIRYKNSIYYVALERFDLLALNMTD